MSESFTMATFQLAERELADFDRRHEPKRLSLLALAEALAAGGWPAVAFEGERSRDPAGAAPPISAYALSGATTVDIVRRRRQLARRLSEAYQALPGPLRERVAAGRADGGAGLSVA